MLSALLLVVLTADARDMRFPDPGPFEVPGATYPGAFDKAPQPHWGRDLPGPRVNAATHTERSRPVIHGEYIYLGSAGGDALYVISRRDGSLVSSFPAGASVEADPVILDERVYFVDTGGNTWCYELNGTLVWKQAAQAPILVRPTVEDGRVYVTTVADEVAAFDALTGEVQWRYQHPRDLSRQADLALYAAPPAVIADNTVILGFSDGQLAGLTRDTGELSWTQRLGEGTYPDIVAPVTAYGGEIYASGYLEPLVAFTPGTGDVRWRHDVGAAAPSLLLEREGTAWLYHPGTDGKLRCYDVRTGDEVWSWDSGTGGSLTEPILTEAGLALGSSDGTVYLVDPVTGDQRWQFAEPQQLDGLSAAPTVEGRQLVFVTNAGRVYSMRAPRGRIRWP